MTLGTKLHNLRKKKDISLDKLAFELELSKTAIGKWESDKAKPSIENLLRICDYYETDVYQLLEEVSNVNFSNARFKGSQYVLYPNNSTINYSTPPELIQNLMDNQKKISDLIVQQNDLFLKLLDKK
jgi:transcriptional regulator with XRE-family HTH domain